MHYLASEHDRDSAFLLGADAQELNPNQAAEVLGGPQAAYHEIIVAPSQPECEAIRARCPEDPGRAAREAGDRLAKAYAQGRPYVLAIHEQDGRFHYHLAVAGPMPERALGRSGQMQKTWDREFHGDEPRIQDWAAHQRFQKERVRLQEVIRAQKENEHTRREAVKRAPPERKADIARALERKARELVEERYQVEVRAIQARYQARGTLGGPRHLVELEQAEHRRTGAMRRLERRETAREIGVAKARLGRAVDSGGRALQKTTSRGGRMAIRAVDMGLKSLGVPRPVRKLTGVSLVLAQEAVQSALLVAQEAAKAAARSSIHMAQASVKLGVGLVTAIPTAGASLKASGKEVAQDLTQAGKELGQGAVRTGAAVGKGATQAAVATGQELIPGGLGLAGQAASVTARTTGGAVKDVLTLSPLSLGQTLAGGALDLGKTAARAAGANTSLPESLRRSFQVAGWVPVVGIAAKAAQVTAETAQAIHNARCRGPEVDR
jgi:ribosomal protein L7/L12